MRKWRLMMGKEGGAALGKGAGRRGDRGTATRERSRGERRRSLRPRTPGVARELQLSRRAWKARRCRHAGRRCRRKGTFSPRISGRRGGPVASHSASLWSAKTKKTRERSFTRKSRGRTRGNTGCMQSSKVGKTAVRGVVALKCLRMEARSAPMVRRNGGGNGRGRAREVAAAGVERPSLSPVCFLSAWSPVCFLSAWSLFQLHHV